jgi:hypothetical protein
MEEQLKRKELRHDRHTVSLLTDHLVFFPKYRGKMLVGDVAMIAEWIICKTCKEMDIEIIENGVANISWLQAVSMDQLEMDGMSFRSIFMSKIRMNIIEKNNINDSYMPRTICTGYTVTEDDRRLMLPSAIKDLKSCC